MSTPSLITVSNGQEFFRIELGDLASALQDGFYRPLERGLTIVGNAQHLFEIPLTDVDAAKADGYQDLLEVEREVGVAAPPPPVRLATHVATAVATPEIQPIDAQEMLMQSASRAEQEEEEERLAREEELAEAEGLGWYKVYLRQWFMARQEYLKRQFGSHSISIAIHVAILLLLASLVMVNDNEPKGLVLSASPASEDVVQEVILEPDLDVTDPTEQEEADSPPEAEEVEMAMTEAVTAPNFMAAISGDSIKPPTIASKSPGTGENESKKKSSVFGTKTTATDYVFVIDNSNSMQRGRFETAINELTIAVKSLNRKQRFYVMFYSDTAYGMFYPRPVKNLVYATNDNKQLLFQWLRYVQLCLKTNGKEALEAAFAFKPDVIYILGDGAFTDGAAKHFSSKPKGKTIVHTRGMEVSPKNSKGFAAIAKRHGGKYLDVGVAPGAVALWQRNPRPRNNKSNGVWGITLGAGKKK